MLPISILENTDHSIVYEIPAGKPNPSQKYSLAEETQDRVYQEAYKGNTCWYYTLNFIRNRIGKVPSDELLKEREIEKLSSVRRKAQTAHENSLPAIANQLQGEIGMRMLKGIDVEKAKWYIKNRAIIQPILETPETLDGAPSLFPFIEEFLREGKCKNMHEFLFNKKSVKRNEINIEFLSKFNINPEQFYGVQPALGRLEDRAHLLARIGLVHRMRFVVPALIVPTVVAAVVTVVLDGNGTGCWFCWAGPRGTDRLPGNCVRGNRAHQRPGDRMGRRQPTRGLGDRDQTVGVGRRVLLLRRDPRLRAVPQRSRGPADRVLMKR